MVKEWQPICDISRAQESAMISSLSLHFEMKGRLIGENRPKNLWAQGFVFELIFKRINIMKDMFTSFNWLIFLLFNIQ
jgi:hypothetical protein